MDKDLHLFYDCDQWKSRDSLRLICVCDADHVEEIYKRIQDDHDYSDEDMDTYIYHECRELNVY